MASPFPTGGKRRHINQSKNYMATHGIWLLSNGWKLWEWRVKRDTAELAETLGSVSQPSTHGLFLLFLLSLRQESQLLPAVTSVHSVLFLPLLSCALSSERMKIADRACCGGIWDVGGMFCDMQELRGSSFGLPRWNSEYICSAAQYRTVLLASTCVCQGINQLLVLRISATRFCVD